jgi:TRAP-type C4-dicarboxylate transport system permease large subunit
MPGIFADSARLTGVIGLIIGLSGLPMEKLVRPLTPFLAAIVAVLLLVAFVPETVLFIPRLLGFVQ